VRVRARPDEVQEFLGLPGRREDDGEQVGDGHGHEDHVSGRPHVLLAQHDDDEYVGQEGDGQDERHDVAVDGEGELGRAVPRGAVDEVALAAVPTLSQGMHLREPNLSLPFEFPR